MVAWVFTQLQRSRRSLFRVLRRQGPEAFYRLVAWSVLERETERMPIATYVQRVREPKKPLVASQFFARYLVFLGLMHLLDCKGVAATTFGGLLTFLLSLRTLGPNRHARLAAVNAWATSWYDARPGSQPHASKNRTSGLAVGQSSTGLT